jgi:hypothetical protein
MVNKAQVLARGLSYLRHHSNAPAFQYSASAPRRGRTGRGRACKTKPIPRGRNGMQLLREKRVMRILAPEHVRQNKANFRPPRRVQGFGDNVFSLFNRRQVVGCAQHTKARPMG